MLKTLSLRNARRQVKDYLLFFAAMMGAVALIYSFNSLIFSQVINDLMGAVSGSGKIYMVIMIVMFSVLITFILGWFISYMMNFILRKRSQELSTYMLLGIEKKQINHMFILENSIIGLAAYLIGLPLGFLLAEILNAMLSKQFGVTYSLSAGFSPSAVGLTFLYFLIIYLFALLNNRRKLKKWQLIDLLKYENHNEELYIQKTFIGIAVFCLSLAAGAASIYLFLQKPLGNPTDGYGIDIFCGSLLVLVCQYGLFAGILPVLSNTLGKNNSWKYRKSHMQLYRLFTSKISNMSTFLGGVAAVFTLSITLFALGISFITTMQRSVDLSAFDLSIYHQGEQKDLSSYSQYLTANDEIEKVYTYNLYTLYGQTFQDMRNETLEPYLDEVGSLLEPEFYLYAENRYDSFMKFSDYAMLREMLGLESVVMQEGELMIHCLSYLKETFTQKLSAGIEISGSKLTCAGIYSEDFYQYDGYGNGQEYLVIIPDELADQMNVQYSLLMATAKTALSSTLLTDFKNHFSSLEYLDDTAMSSSAFTDENGFRSRLYGEGKDYISGKAAGSPAAMMITIILPLYYLALVLCLIGTVILAIQFLSEQNKYLAHYRMLSVLGMDRDAVLTVTRNQILLYFLLPLLPVIVLSSGLIYVICSSILISGFHVPMFSSPSNLTLAIAGFTFALFLAIYGLYGFVSYVSFKREVLRSL